MSFDLPPVKAKPGMPTRFGISETDNGVPNAMSDGATSARAAVEATHPLVNSEKNFHKNRQQMNMALLRNIQGLHAPLRIGMELNAAKKVGRLPFLESSNVMYDVLTGRDIELGPEDVFNTSEFCEYSGQPHAVVEHSLGIL